MPPTLQPPSLTRARLPAGKSPAAALILKLARRGSLSQEEQRVLERLVPVPGDIHAGQDILLEGDRPTSSTLLVSGFAGRYRLLDGGARQITAIYVPGDFLDLDSLVLKRLDHGVTALSPCQVSAVPHEALRRTRRDSDNLAELFWLTTLMHAAIHAEWLVGMGRRTAKAHMAHLFCELCSRLEVVELSSTDAFDFPVTQVDLGDALGLSAVHVNRVLQELRAEALIEWHGGEMRLLDRHRLGGLAEFNDNYLHLRAEPA